MNVVYSALCGVIYVLCLHPVIRFFKRHKTTFILYHDPDPDTFRKHIEYLSQQYSIITLEDFLAYQNSSVALPKYAMVITFDDGHKGNFLLLEILMRFKIKPTIYACSGIIATNRKFWFKLAGSKTGSLKKLDHQKRLEYLKQSMDFYPEQEFSFQERDALTYEEIGQLKQCIDFQSHTHLHPILTTCDKSTVEREIMESRVSLSRMIDRPVVHFAYPNGDYSQREIELLKQAGYKSARTTDVGWNDRLTDPFRLRITGVNDHAPLWMLKAELTGIPGYLYNLYKSGVSRYSLQGRHVPERTPV